MSYHKSKNSQNLQTGGNLNPNFEERECVKLMDILEQEFLNLQKVNEYLKEKCPFLKSLSEKEYLKERKKL